LTARFVASLIAGLSRLPIPIVFMLLSLPCHADIVQRQRSGAVSITLQASPSSPSIAGFLRISLAVEAPVGVPVTLAPLTGAIECGTVAEAEEEPAKWARGGRLVYRETFTIDPAAPGVCHIPALPVECGGIILKTQEIALEVRSPTVNRDDGIRDEQQPVGGLAGTAPPLAILLMALILAVATLFRVVLPPRNVAADSHASRARRRLAEIRSRPMDSRLFCAELTAVLTRYFDEAFGLRTARYTSGETIDAVQRTGFLVSPTATELAALLAECDRVKFSAEPAPCDPVAAAARCGAIIDAVAAQAVSRPRIAAPLEQPDYAAV
jgi:hypothetical protein